MITIKPSKFENEDIPSISLNTTQWLLVCALTFIVVTAVSYQRTAGKIGICTLPGPRFARYSNIWRVWNARSGRAPQNFQKLHREHGKVVRIGPNHVSISDPALVPVIYGVSSKYIKVSDIFYCKYPLPSAQKSI
jgi:hypothetical protein